MFFQKNRRVLRKLFVTGIIIAALGLPSFAAMIPEKGTAESLTTTAARPKTNAAPLDDQSRLEMLLGEVFKSMDDHYYLPVSREIYESFVKEYTAPRLKALNNKTKQTEDFVHLGGGLLVNKLKDSTDKFTNFIPPKKVKEFKKTAYAVTEDLGIEGEKKDSFFLIVRVQRHAEAYAKGIRPGDRIQKIDGKSVAELTNEEIRKKLTAEVGTKVRLEIFFYMDKKIQEIILEVKSYFRETVWLVPSGIKGVCALKIEHFNQATSDDFTLMIKEYGLSNIKHLVLDLRNNEGGPPLGAREILGFFCPPNDYLFAIARKKQRPVMLTAPVQAVLVKTPVTVLVNRGTGSAAEMFSGMLQAKGIGKLVGQKTAGATYLKSLYDLNDGSTIFMITSLTYFFDRRVYPADGLTPDTVLPDSQDSLAYVLNALKKS